MTDQINTKKQKVKVEQIMPQGGNGRKEIADPFLLTEGEKIQLIVIIEKVNTLKAQLDQVSKGLSDLITSIVVIRGLNPEKFGVNLAAGRILPVDVPVNAVESQ